MSELLTCEGLTKCYQKDKAALDNVELHIGFGRIVGLLGPNGSGKTTLIKLANGLLQPTAGSIKIAGMAPGPDTKAIVSYLPDAAWLPDWMRVEQLVEMFRDFYADFDPAKASEMLARLDLAPKAKLKTLSKGNKEKVQLILAKLISSMVWVLCSVVVVLLSFGLFSLFGTLNSSALSELVHGLSAYRTVFGDLLAAVVKGYGFTLVLMTLE